MDDTNTEPLYIETDSTSKLQSLDDSFWELLTTQTEEYISRVLLQDANGFGIILPASVNISEKTIEFVLPDQLSIFSPEETYICRAEIILDSQELIVPFISESRINIKAPSEPEESQDVRLDESHDSRATERLPEPSTTTEDDRRDEDLDAVLDAIAPSSSPRAKAMKGRDVLEEIAKQLDGEFVRSALWHRPYHEQQQPVPAPVARVPEPAVSHNFSPEQLIVKQKMKTLLRNILVG